MTSEPNQEPHTNAAIGLFGWITRPTTSLRFQEYNLRFPERVSLELRLWHAAPDLTPEAINQIYAAFADAVDEAVDSAVKDAVEDAELEAFMLRERIKEIDEEIGDLRRDHRTQIEALEAQAKESEAKLVRAYVIAGKLCVEQMIGRMPIHRRILTRLRRALPF